MLTETLQITVFDNRILDYAISVGGFILGIILIYLIKSIAVSRLKSLSKKTSTTADDFLINAIEKNLLPLLYFAALYISIKSLTLSDGVSTATKIIFAVALTYFIVRAITAFISYSLEHYFTRKYEQTGKIHSLHGVLTISRIIVWSVGITLLLDNLGFEITAVVAGLGIGGIAIALAAQTILGDLFSYFVIFFDRPFETGDFIIIDSYMGSIEHIGIKTTRVRSLGGEQLVFSNTDLTNSRVRNYKRMEKRRIVFSLGVTYQTSTEKLRTITGIIKAAVQSVPDTAFDRAHFAAYGAYSLNFEVVYYVLSGDYNKYMDIQQNINFLIKEEFEKQGIEFAYPTQTLLMEKSAQSV
ncbi:MAG: mechanosensitive ion channel family protein [Nitrospira sp.]|nr:mechanosensitive ion channel family protein [bacterium]MBL7049381.1 mechanosensitive ion channel family protein [Nitrospira sp.]